MKDSNFDVIIIGGGAAGLMAVSSATYYGKKVLLIEKKEKPARKILVTGKGRCNVTNNCDVETLMKNVRHNGKFLYSAFNTFDSQSTMDFFEGCGVELKTERGNRVFPISDRATDIADALISKTRSELCTVVNERATEIITENNKVIGVKTETGEYYGNSVIISTGGKSYPKTGSTGDGYELAKKVGHNIIKPSPGLIPIEIEGKLCKKLMGLSLKNVTLEVINIKTGKSLYKELGEMLFTHFGISGPLVLSASMYIEEDKINDYEIILDLKPALSEIQLDARLLREFKENANKDFVNAVGSLLPSKLIGQFVALTGIDGRLKVNQISKEQRETIISLLKCIKLKPTALRPIDEAIVTVGGVDTKEINPKTMESKIVEGLYFAGEVTDLDAYTGGFNLQIAFSTGYLAGINA